jgi:hypothetical protein
VVEILTRARGDHHPLARRDRRRDRPCQYGMNRVIVSFSDSPAAVGWLQIL